LAATVGDTLPTDMLNGTNSAYPSVQRDKSVLVSAALDGVCVYEIRSSRDEYLNALTEVIQAQRSEACLDGTLQGESAGGLTQDDVLGRQKEIMAFVPDLKATLQRAEHVLYDDLTQSADNEDTNKDAAMAKVLELAATLKTDAAALTDSLRIRAFRKTNTQARGRGSGVSGKTISKKR
jgi:hypothetical protein